MDKVDDSTKSILYQLSKYYREVLKYVASSASRVLQNVANGQRFGLIADLALLVTDPENLKKQIIRISKPKKEIEIKKFKAEEAENGENEEEQDLEEPEITDEEIAWSAVNKIWRTQENNPYERETVIGEYLVKTVANKKNLLAPLLLTQIEITYDPETSSFNLTKLSTKPDLNRSLIATLLADDNLAPVRSEINELYLEAEDIDLNILKKIVNLLSNHVPTLKSIEIIEDNISLNDVAASDKDNFIANTYVLINTPRTSSFILDDLDELTESEADISNTPIEDLLTVDFKESEGDSSGESTNLKQDIYFFPLKSNIHQQRICDNVMSKRLTVVWGPPGTGKSETISNLVCHLIANGKSVLVTSQQEKALEVVREKLRKNVSLTTPRHPNLTIPLELALIKGEKEETIAADIKQKLDALGVYTLGLSSFEIQSKLNDISASLKENKRNQLELMKRFTELKLLEKNRYLSKDDSPLRLEKYREYSILDSSESFSVEDPNRNAKQINRFAYLLSVFKEDRPKYIDKYGTDLHKLSQIQESIRAILSILQRIQNSLALSSKTEISFIKELIGTYSPSEAYEISNSLSGIWVSLQKIAYELSLSGKKFEKYIQHLSQIPKESYELASKILTKLELLDVDVQNYDLAVDIDLDSIEINQLIEDLEILKNTKPNLFTNIFDSKAKDSLHRVSKILQLSGNDWRSKSLICDQLDKVIRLKKAKKTLVNILEEIKSLPFEISTNKLTVEHLQEFILELKGLVDIGSLLKNSNVISSFKNTPQIIAKYINIDNLENTKICTSEIKTLNANFDVLKSLILSYKLREVSPDLLSSSQIAKLTSEFETLDILINNLTEYVNIFHALSSLPISRKNITKLLEENKYVLPTIFEKSEIIVECHRLVRLYGSDVVQETTQVVAERLKKLVAKNKQLIYEYILNVRLITLHEASHSKLANSNLVKLKNLLGKKKKTLNFLKKKNSVDFSQVLYYFPCWLVTIDDVARYFPLVKGLFDYVIVDEASQCSQTAIPHLFYRAKNAVIVGDEKQLPNANLRFLQKGIMDSLQRKYKINSHDKSQFFDCKEYSLLTFAQAATPLLPLIEHFRCDPTIIQWSNEHVYNRMMKILTPVWETRFAPPMEVRYLPNGAEDVEAKVNPVEAEVIVEELKNLVTDKAYDDLTIGVISPFRAQADLISEMIYKELDPEIIRKFAIQSRTVDGFQGDERDVIIYSMRFSPNGKPGSITAIETGVNEEGFKRMNVAFTRARRKVIIYTSQKPSMFPGKYIKSFMQHAQYVQENYVDPFSPKDDQFDSQFEEDVCRLFRGRGLNVITQFPCAGYRIDQVVIDKEGRTLAIECDGDFKLDETGDLPPEHYMRQATIERVTQWDVQRITASQFYLNPETTIDQVIHLLKMQPTPTERKLNQINIEQKESAVGLVSSKKEEEEVEQVLNLVESKPQVEKETSLKKRKNKTKPYLSQTPLFDDELEKMLLDKNTWFQLSHWGKTTGNFSSFQNRFSYSLGVYVAHKGTLTEKQKAYGKKLLESAKTQGFLNHS